MKKYFLLLTILLSTLFSANAMAYTPPPAPQNGWYISDQAGKLSQTDITILNRKIDRISKVTKNEFGILLLQDMGGDNIEDVTNATFKAWGVGKRGLDNGCLIVVAIKERKTRIETGKGIEGEVTDLQASDILRKNLAPHLKRGDFAGGLSETLDALSGLMESRASKKPEVNSGGCDIGGAGAPDWDASLIFIILISAGLVLLVFRSPKLLEKEKNAKRIIVIFQIQHCLKKIMSTVLINWKKAISLSIQLLIHLQ